MSCCFWKCMKSVDYIDFWVGDCKVLGKWWWTPFSHSSKHRQPLLVFATVITNNAFFLCSWQISRCLSDCSLHGDSGFAIAKARTGVNRHETDEPYYLCGCWGDFYSRNAISTDVSVKKFTTASVCQWLVCWDKSSTVSASVGRFLRRIFKW